ncbi:MAG TPA: hypothetical protein VKK31_27970 [Thermoanaerobaculia bacterium]|nr:hypothetical protein [Thermoanaerobaculia bacterium]
MRVFAHLVIASLFSASLWAQPVEIKLRVTPVDTPTRRSDTLFQLAFTSGFSVVQTLTNNYYLFGSAGTYRRAWNSAGTDMWDMEFPPPVPPGSTDWPGYNGTKPCDPKKNPLLRDVRCGDASGVVWKQPTSTALRWNYFDQTTGSTNNIPQFPAVGSWPRQWPAQYPLTGITGHQTTIDAAKINAAIPTRTLPTATPMACTRDDWNPGFLSTGAADTKVTYVNGQWYMAFNETINNPTATGGWTADDLFNVGWATSTDGRNWSIKRILFRTTLETVYCGGGLVLTQLFTDNGYFYMVLNELGNDGVVADSRVLLLRALIDTANPDGYTTWQIASRDPANPNAYLWRNTPSSGLLNTSPSGLDAFPVMPTLSYVKQTAIARVFNSSAANSPSRIIGITVSEPTLNNASLQVWSAPDLNTPFTFESQVDAAYIKPASIFGWEFAFSYYPDHSAATPRIVGKELDFWLNGNFYTGGNLDGHGKHLTGYRTTATLSGGIFAPRGAFRTTASYYVSAAANNSINATPTSYALNERWVIIDTNGGALISGDVVNLQARNGLFVTNSGGTTLTASQAAASTNEIFFIEKKNAGGTTIVNGDLIAFRSQSTSKYIIAAGGGGSSVTNNGLDTNPNTRFVFVAN